MVLKLTKPDRLSLFTLLWAIANLFHSLAYPGALMKPLAFFTFFFAVLLVFRPKSILLFIFLLFFSVCNTFRAIPFTSNHLLLDFAINIGILITLLSALIPAVSKSNLRTALQNLDREKLFNTFAPVARVGLLILYFFAVLHKLNWDYFNPVVSCANWYLGVFREHGFTLIPDNAFVQTASIYSSLMVEAGIPLLLFFRKTRMWGILLGLGFHYFLSLDPHEGMFSFVILLFSLYFLFTPTYFTDRLYLVVKGLVNHQKQYLKIFVPLSIVGLMIVLAILSVVNYPHPIKYIPFTIWYVWGMFMIVLYLTVILSQNSDNAYSDGFFRIKRVGLLIIPIVLFVNGLSPYLGIKTQLSYSMFSNLKTEGGITNHLFIPGNFQMTDWQQDLVEVKETDLEKLLPIVQKGQLLTFFELKRIVSNAPKNKDYYVKYSRDQENHTLTYKNGVSSEPELTKPHPWLLAKFIRFRPVDKGPCLCKH